MNRRQYQFLYSNIPMLSVVTGSATIGAAGAVTATTGVGISSVTNLATGLYQIQFVDAFPAYVGSNFLFDSPLTGAAVNAGSFVVGTLYKITTLGNTDWAAIGLNAGLTPAVGQVFVATGVGAGTGTATAVGSSGILAVEVAPGLNMLSVNTANQGSIFIIRCLDAAGALANPASGSVLEIEMYMKNSTAFGA
jgi:hypothetical protein